MLVTVLVATALGFLTGLGIGGGSLLILWLTAVLGMEQQTARSLNLLFFLPSALVSCLLRRKQGLLNWKAFLPAILSGSIAAAVFTCIGANVDTKLLRKLFGGLLILTGLRELLYKPRDDTACPAHTEEKGGCEMIQNDTIRLLRECDAGVKMGVASIDDVLPHVTSEPFQKELTKCRQEHDQLGDEIRQLLDKYHDEGKKPNPLTKGMSWMKTSMRLGLEESDAAIADLMTDGCNMGIKSLSRYLNQYKAADEKSKNIAKRLIAQEDRLLQTARDYL